MDDLNAYLLFLKDYLISRLLSAGHGFEGIKDVIVAFLIVKRGRYSSSFLNFSFLFIIAATFIAGPTIIQNSPFGQPPEAQATESTSVISYNPYQGSLETVISDKGRTGMVQYTVKGGDTVAAIAKRFGVSEDTIRWANETIKNDIIKPGEVLQIPPITGIAHKVVSGDTIYSIAKKYHVDAQNIVNYPFNDYADLDTFALTVGQYIYVPDGTIVPVPIASSQFIAPIQAGTRGPSNFIWPTSGIITQYPVWYHMALDIANPSAPPILAADTGVVIRAGWDNTGYGNMVMIDHGNGYRTLYGHMSQILVSVGQHVNQGQQIGVMGSTGRSTGTHLHFEIRSAADALLNPLNFLK